MIGPRSSSGSLSTNMVTRKWILIVAWVALFTSCPSKEKGIAAPGATNSNLVYWQNMGGLLVL